MMKVKKTRARRTFSRKKRRVGKVTKTVKTYVQRSIASKLESKNVCIIDTITKAAILDGLGYYRTAPAAIITPGVTDRGRIGDTVYLTGITIKYKFQADANSNFNSPITWHWYVVKMKSRFATPDDVWFKSFDSGAINAYVGLSQVAVQDGRRKLNTQAFTVLGHKKITLHPGSGTAYRQAKTGMMITRMKMLKQKFNTNSTVGSGLQEFTPGIYVIGYPYDGDSENYAEYQDFAIRFCIDLTYKD